MATKRSSKVGRHDARAVADEESFGARSHGAVQMNPYVSSHAARPETRRSRNLVGIVILLAIVAVMGVGGFVLWNLAQATGSKTMADDTLSAAISGQTTSAATDSEVSASMDSFTNVLVFAVDDVTLGNPTLSSALVVCADSTTGKAKVAELPLDAKVSETSLASLFASKGQAACVSPVAAATGLTFSHVAVIDAAALKEAEGMGSANASQLMEKASSLLSRMRTDMGTTELVDFVGTMARIGSGNVGKVNVTSQGETLSDGTTVSVIDARELGLSLGTLVSSSQA